MKKVIFILLLLNTLNYGSDTVVIKSLEWQDNSVVKTNKMNWKDAIEYCKELSLNDNNDWYLPSIKELQKIVDIVRYNPAIKGVFKNTNDYYWSSSSSVYDKKEAWPINFKSGNIYPYRKTNKYFVRCVRHRQ